MRRAGTTGQPLSGTIRTESFLSMLRSATATRTVRDLCRSIKEEQHPSLRLNRIIALGPEFIC